jgi:cytochrome P450
MPRTPSLEKPLPPGNLGLPFIGETAGFLRDTSKFLDERFEKHGAIFKTRILGDDVVCLGGHRAFTFFMDDTFFTRRGASPRHLQEILNPDAMPFIHDEPHRKRKRLILQAFRPKALDVYMPAIERVIARYVARWEKMGSFAWVPELEAMSFAIADTLFAGADPDVDNPTIAADFARCVDGMLAVPIRLPFTRLGRALAARDKMMAYVNAAIEAHKRDPSKRDLLAQVLAARDDQGHALPEREIQIELLHFYFAAHSAIYSALAYHAMLLAQHEAARDKARAEVARVARTGPLTMDVIRRLEYVHQTCLESRRWSAVVPLTFFATVRRSFDYEGYHVPEGWKAFGLIRATMHDESAFAKADSFDPDRFGADRDEQVKHENAYVAQGGGAEDSHRCAGEKLSHVIMTAFTTHLLRGYTWELPPQDLGPRRGRLSPTPKDDLRGKFRRV